MIRDKMSDAWFNMVHRTSLIYNTCWEDPRLDRVALELNSDDNVLVITSAGCNALDYALDSPRHIYAVDMNPRQNALLELKQAAIRELDHDTFFSLFGKGKLQSWDDAYNDALRDHLSPWSQRYWDRNGKFFSGKGWRKSLYFHGASGTFARLINHYIDNVIKVRDEIFSLLDCNNVDSQKEIYFSSLKDEFWTPFLRWFIRRDSALSMLGVPRAQRQQVENGYVGGIAQFIEDSVEAVFTHLPLSDNYFWRVYLTGEYSRHCCPEYLNKESFEKLKAGLVDKVSVHTNSILGFLNEEQPAISKYVLLDHMDWLSVHRKDVLVQEWQALLDNCAPQTRMLWRSGGLRTDYIDPIEIQFGGSRTEVGQVLRYNRSLADELHPKDRVHTYGSFYIADVLAN